MRGAGFDFDEAEHVFVPADQVDLPGMPRRTKIARHHDVTATPQVEISFFLTAAAGYLVGWSLDIFGGNFADDEVQSAEEGLGDPAREHGLSISPRISGRSDEVTTKACGFPAAALFLR